MSVKLKAGMYIAQSDEINVLLMLDGTAPMLEVIVALDLNAFKRGKVIALKKDSVAVLDIMRNPERYNFELPSITDAIDKLRGASTLGFIASNEKEEDEAKYLTRYKELVSLHNDITKAGNVLLVEMKEQYNISIPRGNGILKKIKAVISNT